MNRISISYFTFHFCVFVQKIMHRISIYLSIFVWKIIYCISIYPHLPPALPIILSTHCHSLLDLLCSLSHSLYLLHHFWFNHVGICNLNFKKRQNYHQRTVIPHQIYQELLAKACTSSHPSPITAQPCVKLTNK